MNADEVVSALRCCNRSKGHRCSECPVFSRYEHRICKATVDRFAADLIESLQAQLADYHHMSELVDGKMEENQRLRRINENLQEQLAASQCREKAAVEDIYKMTDGCECDICKHYNPDKNTCAKPFVPYDDCFEWRGAKGGAE